MGRCQIQNAVTAIQEGQISECTVEHQCKASAKTFKAANFIKVPLDRPNCIKQYEPVNTKPNQSESVLCFCR